MERAGIYHAHDQHHCLPRPAAQLAYEQKHNEGRLFTIKISSHSYPVYPTDHGRREQLLACPRSTAQRTRPLQKTNLYSAILFASVPIKHPLDFSDTASEAKKCLAFRARRMQ